MDTENKEIHQLKASCLPANPLADALADSIHGQAGLSPGQSG